MTGEQFTEWMEHMGFNKLQAAEALGAGRNSIPRWQEKGTDRTIALACSAIAEKLPPWPMKTPSR